MYRFRYWLCQYIMTVVMDVLCFVTAFAFKVNDIFAFPFGFHLQFPFLNNLFFFHPCFFYVIWLKIFCFIINGYNILNFRAGSAETPQFMSRRCIIMLILLFGFCMFQFYSASIVGSLLMEKPKTIKTLRNLIDSPLELGIEDIVYNKDFFKVSTSKHSLLNTYK